MRWVQTVSSGLAVVVLAGCATAPPPPPLQPLASPEAQFLIGRVADLRGDSAGAAESLLEAARADSANPVIVLSALRAALEAGDFERALEAARMADALEAATPEAALTLATDAIAKGKHQVADAYLSDVHGSPLARTARETLSAWSFAARGRTDAALALLAADTETPLGPLLSLQRAMMLDRAGRNAEALAAYKASEAGGLRTPTARILQARLLERMGRRDEALALLDASGDQTVLNARERARIESAARAPRLERAESGAAISLMTLASLLAGQAPADLVTPYLTLALRLDPKLDAARLVFAETIQAEAEGGDEALGAALRILEGVPESSPLATLALVRKAFILRALERDEDALQAAMAAVAQADTPTAQRALGDLYRSLRRYAEAEAIYDRLVKAGAGDDWRLLFARGAMRERLGRWRDAEADLLKALEIEPDQPEVMNYLAFGWVERGENEAKALAMLSAAVAASPDSGHIIDSLGWAHFKRGDYELALVHLERAVELEPNNAEVNDHLGDLYWRLGRKREAGFQWTRALSLEPEPDHATRLNAKLKQGLPPLAAVKPLARAP